MNQTFVARQKELERLDSLLKKAFSGEMQVCFVTGEAGAGKSTLLAEFARQAQETNEQLLFVTGNCNAQTGISDPYLPFRHILGMLTGDEARLATNATSDKNARRLKELLKTSGRALVEIAPELVSTLIPGAGILVALARLGVKERGLLEGLEKHAATSQRSPSEIEQSQVFLQYTAFLRKLAQEHPLIIVLDDLQWVDAASNALFFHLTRELTGARILLVGLYRPNDVAAGRNQDRHPLEQTVNEIKRYHGDVWIDLDRTTTRDGRAFVEAFINHATSNLSPAFREALFQHTNGHALFTVELFRKMQETGDLVQDATGQWHEAPNLDWHKLPTKIEAIIEERIERLTDELREILTIASVEGQDFTAQVIAKVQQLKERDILKKLSNELERRHQLVREVGEVKLGTTILARYTFNHALFQIYLYRVMGIAERRLLHTDVAAVLEELYTGRMEEISVQLAHHYKQTGDLKKTIHYLQIAGERAFRLGAFNQAREFFEQALEVLEEDNLDDDKAIRAHLELQIGDMYYHTGHWSTAEEKYRHGLEIARMSGIDDLITQGLLNLSQSLHRQNQHFDELLQTAREALEITRQTGNRRLECRALQALGIAYGKIDRTNERLACYKDALEIAKEMSDVALEMSCLNNLGTLFNTVGDFVSAITYRERALELANQFHRLADQSVFLSNLKSYSKVGNYQKAKQVAERTLELRNRLGDVPGLAIAHLDLGIALFHLGFIDQAVAQWIKSIEMGDRHDRITVQVGGRNWLGIAYLHLNREDDAAQLISELKPLLARFKNKIYVNSEILLEAIVKLRTGEFEQASRLFEQELAYSTQALTSQVWVYYYHRALAQAGISLLASSEDSSSHLKQTETLIREAVAYCGWVGVLDDVLLILRELRKVDRNNLLKPIEDELIEKREIAWLNRPFKDEDAAMGIYQQLGIAML